jgi:poly-gamma-glutamate synthesis protein (capsule biosynthesis protein)
MNDVVRIAAVGDVMLGDAFYHMGRGVRNILCERGNDFTFAEVRQLLRWHDVVVGNLECVLSDADLRPNRLTSMQYRGRQDFIGCLLDGNFSAMSISNNHILEHGPSALLETINLLESAGILAVGLPEVRQRLNPERCLVEVGGMSIAFLGYCLYRDRHTEAIVARLPDILEDVRVFARLADRVIVSLHWGIEYMPIPAPSQIDIAHGIIDAGSSVVLGHHPHVLQGIEEYNGAVIAYSLGNFVFSTWLPETRSSVILSISLDKEGPVKFDIVPVIINGEWQPVPVSGDEAQKIMDQIAARTRALTSDNLLLCQDNRRYSQMAADVLKTHRRQLRRYILSSLWRQPSWVAIQLMTRPILHYLKG